jgi:phage tail protein X
MSTYELFTVKGDNLTVSKIVWRRFRRTRPGLVERILADNPGLAGHGEYISVGTVIRIPNDAPNIIVKEATATSLWD